MDAFIGADGEQARESVVEMCLQLLRDGLVVSTAGNVSIRLDDRHVLITPTGVAYRRMRPADLPVLRITDGLQVSGDLAPTSEWEMHLRCYQLASPDGEPVNAVVHTHAPYSTAASTLLTTVPNLHYALASCGGPVRVAEYATYGSPALARAAVAALHGRKAALLANHGTLAVGADLDAAYDRTSILEWTCKVWLAARAAGEPSVISDDDFSKVVEKLKGYGQRSRPASGEA